MLQSEPSSYVEADDILGRRTSRKIANNTYMERVADTGQILIRLHRTAIVTYNPNGTIVLRSDGWESVTTKERLNRYLPPGISIYSEKGEWSVSDRRAEFQPLGLHGYDSPGAARLAKWGLSFEVDFTDGMLILPDASLHGVDRRPADCSLALACYNLEKARARTIGATQ